ncbi:STM4011 family radical SAM protein [Paenibacillus sp. J5C_2022]|uniref:STM4011 family radical SAM protein n=1 Tax=Paenibacillus sp. J5C2022 TaxID=2977129 RepID=UPI0021CEC531|nr:STM4011 family radical SAM protein [Paenibacillus sp. J5C2022]MCU6708264.1 STM4011 family radical SAM protein [Paenibacillus sp. J5C2022]
MKATIYYRGSLTSCNYDCPYCPFSKNKDSAATLAKDKEQLLRFIAWVREQELAGHELYIFFNPYGEGLIHRWYREGMAALSHMPHVRKVVIQTNLSANVNWTDTLHREKAAFWVTYHPGQCKEEAFVAQCTELYKQGISFSVGTVGVRSAFEAIASIRRRLPQDVYVWVNAFKDVPDYYTVEEAEELRRLDPLFDLNRADYDSLGKRCMAGEDVFYVLGSGRVKRCYKDRAVIGDLYRDGLEGLSKQRLCRMKQCGCYIGYKHMPELAMADWYGDGLLERVPTQYASIAHKLDGQAAREQEEQRWKTHPASRD